jgi:hypothetical protein
MQIDHRARQLAKPPMHPDIPREYRIETLELVLRRQFGAAWDMAVELEIDRRDGRFEQKPVLTPSDLREVLKKEHQARRDGTKITEGLINYLMRADTEAYPETASEVAADERRAKDAANGTNSGLVRRTYPMGVASGTLPLRTKDDTPVTRRAIKVGPVDR